MPHLAARLLELVSGFARGFREEYLRRGFVDFEHPIPLYVSGFGPRALGLAGKHGD